MLANTYNIIIDSGVEAPGYGREVVNGLNATGKRFLSMLKTTVKLTGAPAYDTQMEMHTSTVNTDISIEREFKCFFRTNTQKRSDISG